MFILIGDIWCTTNVVSIEVKSNAELAHKLELNPLFSDVEHMKENSPLRCSVSCTSSRTLVDLVLMLLAAGFH